MNKAGKEIEFAHDCVDVQFSYDMAKVEKLEDAKPRAIFNASVLEMDFRVSANRQSQVEHPLVPILNGN